LAMVGYFSVQSHLASGREAEETDASAQQTSVGATDEIQNLSFGEARGGR
jgi:hypothetical protein